MYGDVLYTVGPDDVLAACTILVYECCFHILIFRQMVAEWSSHLPVPLGIPGLMPDMGDNMSKILAEILNITSLRPLQTRIRT